MATKPNITRDMTNTNFTKAAKTRDIKYIVIHWVGAVSSAAGNAKYFKAYRGSSAHYFVDTSGIIQIIEDWNVAWHCGTKGTYYHKYCRNSNSIGIEMCLDSANHISDVTISNTAMLVQYLMDKYHITAENVVRHYDVTHKSCPGIYVQNSAWSPIHKRLTQKQVSSFTTTDPASNGNVSFPSSHSIDVNLYGIVDDDEGVSLRTKPFGGDKVSGYKNGIPDGTVVFINAKQDGKYFVTLTNGVKGWVSGAKVCLGNEYKVTTNSQSLMLRAGKGTDYGVLRKIPKGATVTQLRHYSNGWEKLIYDYVVGYASSKYLKPVNG